MQNHDSRQILEAMDMKSIPEAMQHEIDLKNRKKDPESSAYQRQTLMQLECPAEGFIP